MNIRWTTLAMSGSSVRVEQGDHGFVSTKDNIDDLRSVASFTTGVPEPASWAMMLAGFGVVGAMSRRARRVTVTA